MSTPLRQSQRIAARKAASLLSSDTHQLELQFAASLKLHQASPKPQAQAECKAEAGKEKEEEEYDTPERKVGVWSQQLDHCLTAKKEDSSQSSQPEQDRFKTPPRRLTIPTLEQLERWDRMDRETHRRF